MEKLRQMVAVTCQDYIAGESGWSQDLNLGGPAPTTGLLTGMFCYLPIIVMTIVITAFIY